MSPYVSEFFERLKKVVVDALFPAQCAVCGSFLDAPAVAQRCNSPRGNRADQISNSSLAARVKELFNMYLCPGCVNDVAAVEAPICITCGFMFKNGHGKNRMCEDCLSSPKRFRIARASVIYDRALMSLMHSFKYHGKIQLANPFGALLLHAFQRWWDADAIDLVIPVPLHRRRLKRRGYNQALLLIAQWKKMSAEFSMDIAGIRIDNDSLVRNRSTAPQTGLGRDERKANLKNAFHVRQADNIGGMRILLIDDVYTTGTTVNECARELLENGAQFVDVLTVARTI